MEFLKWLYPGMNLKRWLFLFSLGVIVVSIGLAMALNYQYIGALEETIFRIVYLLTGQYSYTVTMISGLFLVFCGLGVMTYATRKIIRSIVSALLPDSKDKLVEVMFKQRRLNRGSVITVIGGGTGLSVLLRGIKNVTSNITAVVTVADDGGSSGRLREDFGIVPPGDMRNCLVALADREPLMEKLFQYRFGGGGDLAGHSFGNLFIAAMSQVVGDMEAALQESSKILKVRGQVLPASKETLRLAAEMQDGTIVEGESKIPLTGKAIRKLSIIPVDAKPVESVLQAIMQANVCILGPGSLYTSVLPNLLVPQIAETLRQTKAVKIYICNVMTQPGETDGYKASDHLQAIFDHVGSGMVDYVVVNSQKVEPSLQETYALEGAYQVEPDVDVLHSMGVKVVEANLISQTNLVRHHPVKLSRTIMSLVNRLITGKEHMNPLDYYLIGKDTEENIDK